MTTSYWKLPSKSKSMPLRTMCVSRTHRTHDQPARRTRQRAHPDGPRRMARRTVVARPGRQRRTPLGIRPGHQTVFVNRNLWATVHVLRSHQQCPIQTRSNGQRHNDYDETPDSRVDTERLQRRRWARLERHAQPSQSRRRELSRSIQNGGRL